MFTRRMIANGFFHRRHQYSLIDILTHVIVKNRQDKVKFEPDWMVEALKICAFTSALELVDDPFEIFKPFDKERSRSYAYNVRAALTRKTTREYRNVAQVFQDMYESLYQATRNHKDDSIIHILEKDGSLSPIATHHKALLSTRERVLKYVSGTIGITTFQDYNEEQFYLEKVNDSVSNRLTRSIKPYRQAGSVVIRFPNKDQIQSETEHITDIEGYGYFNTCETIEFHNAFVKYFRFLAECDNPIGGSTTTDYEKLQEAITVLLHAMHNPVPMESLTKSLDFVVDMIENYDRPLGFGERAAGVRWDLFGEALLSYCGGNHLPEQTILKLRECVLLSTNEESFSRILGCLKLRDFHWYANWWPTGWLQEANKFSKKHSPKLELIISDITRGKLIGVHVIDSLLAQCNSIQDPSDAFWYAAWIALNLKDSDPHFCEKVHTYALTCTNSQEVSRRSPFPDKVEWYRRICGGDNEQPGAYENAFRNGANTLSDITRDVKKRSVTPTTTTQTLTDRALYS